MVFCCSLLGYILEFIVRHNYVLMVFCCSLLDYILEFIARHNYVLMVFEYGLIAISFQLLCLLLLG